jgi:hypothetical protein
MRPYSCKKKYHASPKGSSHKNIYIKINDDLILLIKKDLKIKNKETILFVTNYFFNCYPQLKDVIKIIRLRKIKLKSAHFIEYLYKILRMELYSLCNILDE